VNRTSLYRKDPEPSEEEVRIKHLIGRIHTERPARGSRGIRDDINNMKLGFRVNRKRIQRYMKDFVLKAARDAIARHGTPTILNSDQGSQFTCPDYVNLLKENTILISMDGKGRALDNAITERFWRTLKWEDVYLMQYDTPKALRIGIDKYIRYYTEERSHSSLEGATPSSVYYSNNLTPKAA
jgi:transposase InsO family protein